MVKGTEKRVLRVKCGPGGKVEEAFLIMKPGWESESRESIVGEAEKLIQTGRCHYTHVNDRCGPPYTIVLDDDYAVYCPWMADSKPVGKTWNKELTDAAVELLDSQKENREQRRKKRGQGK